MEDTPLLIPPFPAIMSITRDEITPPAQYEMNHLTEDKKDPYATEVLPSVDIESGESLEDDAHGYQRIPPGVDPDLMRREQVHRGLKQRHIQVC